MSYSFYSFDGLKNMGFIKWGDDMKMHLRHFFFIFLCIFLFFGSAEGAIVAEYLFDGNANDSSGFNQNGTLMGSASFGSGNFGQALILNGSSDYVSVDINNHDLSNFTIELWVNVPTYDSNLHYVSLYQNAYLVLGDYDSGQISTWADGLSPIALHGSAPGLTINQWHHFAFTFDGSIQRVFIDGVMVEEQVTSGSVTLDTGSFNSGLNIGARYTGNTQFVQGAIDNVRIHDIALSAQDLGFFTDSNGTAEPIPTLSEWGLIIFSLLLAGIAIWYMRNQSHRGSIA